jgi:hypothetical protein
MRLNSSRWGLHGLAFCFVLAVGGAAVAVEPNDESELYLNTEFMIMNSFGTGGDAFEVKLENDDGNASTETIEADSDADFGWRGDLWWKEGPWGVGVSGFHYDNDADEDAFLPNEAAQTEVVLRNATNAWDCREDDGDDLGHCYGTYDSDWEFWMVDLYAVRELVATPDVAVDLQAGLRIASFDQERSGFLAEIEDADLVTGLTPVLSENAVSFDSTSEADDPLVGPFVSLLSTGRFGRFRLEGQITQAVVFGKANRGVVVGQLNDPANFGSSCSSSPAFNCFLETLALEEASSLSGDEDLTIPITDVRIRIGYELIDNLVLGFGGYASTWFNVPRPPNSESSDFKEGPSTFLGGDETITMVGASFSISYAFKSGGLLPF